MKRSFQAKTENVKVPISFSIFGLGYRADTHPLQCSAWPDKGRAEGEERECSYPFWWGLYPRCLP